VLVAIAVGLSAVLMVTMTARAVIARADCTDQPILVNMAVSPDIAPAIEIVARTFNGQNHQTGGRCVQVEVNEEDSAAVAGQLDGQAPAPGMPSIDAWIPDSSLWVDVVRSYPAGAQVAQPTGIRVARSPLLIVTSQAVDAQTHALDGLVGWNLLLPSSLGGLAASLHVGVELPDPASSAVGLATLIEVSRQLGAGLNGRQGFTKFVYSSEATAEFSSAAALTSFVGSTGPPFARAAITVASEQSVLAYDRANPARPLVARYPSGASAALGTPELDYPYVLTSSEPAQLQAARQFGAALEQSYAASVIRYYGFRSANGDPDVMPAADGLSAQTLQLATQPAASEAATNLLSYQALGAGTRQLILLDVSAAMKQPDGDGTQTLEQEVTATASIGIGLFPENSVVGLWEMGDGLGAGAGYQQLVPMGPITAPVGLLSRSEQIAQITENLQPGAESEALNTAILAAYRRMTQTYSASYVNALVVLTAGEQGPHDLALSSLLSQLRRLFNPDRSIEIVLLQLGTQGNFGALRQIAAATGGVAYQISNPADVGTVFIKGMTHRICSQGCTQP
jgi:Ca-activated chloride channel family protein